MIRVEEIRDNELTVRAEFCCGSFYRSLPLPSCVEEIDVKATYKDGVHEV